MALGELVEESKGKTTNGRVLDVDPPKVVTSFKMEGNFKETLHGNWVLHGCAWRGRNITR
jgi:hypothetical protein